MRLIFAIAVWFVMGFTTTANAGVTNSLMNPLCPAIATGIPASAQTTGFVKLASGRSLYTHYVKPAPGQPTIVLVNGLTYRIGCWDAFVHELHGEGYGILRYDPMGHGETLRKYSKKIEAIDYEDQTEDLLQLLDALKLQTAHLVGLSYGGGIGFDFASKHPERVATLIAMAPFVAPIPWQDKYLQLQVEQTRLLNPFLTWSDDEIYDWYLRRFVYSTYPSYEPIVLETPHKLEATFRLVQGIRKFHVVDILHKLPQGKLHLVLAGDDTYVPKDMHEKFWSSIPKGVAASRLTIAGAGHKIPELEPQFSARWVKEIVRGNPKLSQGRQFTGQPWTGKATAGSVVVDGLGGR
ncbi:MAG: alpha/beta hydrolase [Bdellovibrionota bacterium]